MKFNKETVVYGDLKYRNKKCPIEDAEQITFFNQLKKLWPEHAKLATHIKNEGKRNYKQVSKDKANGLNQGFADVVIIGCPVLYMEIKRQDHTLSNWEENQEDKLILANERGAFSCVALGYEAALKAVKDWNDVQGR